jgi:transposase
MALADALGNLAGFRLLPGQAHDLRGTAALIEGLTCGQLLADRAFDANWVREALAKAKIEAVIPPKTNRRFPAVNGRVKVSQRAAQNVATLGLARLPRERAPASGRPRFS